MRLKANYGKNTRQMIYMSVNIPQHQNIHKLCVFTVRIFICIERKESKIAKTLQKLEALEVYREVICYYHQYCQWRFKVRNVSTTTSLPKRKTALSHHRDGADKMSFNAWIIIYFNVYVTNFTVNLFSCYFPFLVTLNQNRKCLKKTIKYEFKCTPSSLPQTRS